MESIAQDGLHLADQELSKAVGHRPRRPNGTIFKKNETPRFSVVRMPEAKEEEAMRPYDAFVLKLMKAAEPKLLSTDEIWSWLVSMGKAKCRPHRQSLDRKVTWKRLRRLLHGGWIRVIINEDEQLMDVFDPVI